MAFTMRASSSLKSFIRLPHAVQPVAAPVFPWACQSTPLAPQGVRHASLKALSIRLRAVKGIGKITKAMKMVAASKLRGAQTKMEMSRPFAGCVRDFLADTLTVKDDGEVNKMLLVPISSDKGLCGGVNSSIAKACKLQIGEAEGIETEVFIVGSKVKDGLARGYSHLFGTTVDEIYQKPFSFATACYLSEDILKSEFDKISLWYNKFNSVISFDPTEITIGSYAQLDESDALDMYEFEGERSEILGDMYEFYVSSLVFNCVLENACSENASRMTAMENATNNARDMTEKLNLQYNRIRQAVITTELMEIIAGSESV